MLRKNDVITLDITGVTQEGYGVGRADGQVVFVRSAAEGDRAEVRVLKAAKTYAWAKIERLFKASENRVENDACPVSGRCGGCAFRHITYQAEFRAKVQRVYDALTRIGGQSPDIAPDRVCPALAEDGLSPMEYYRNKAIYPVTRDRSGVIRVGFYGAASHNVVECPDCRIQDRRINGYLAAIRRYLTENDTSVYDETTGQGLLRGLYFRVTSLGQAMLTIILNAADEAALRRFPGAERWLRGLVTFVQAECPDIVSVFANWHTRRDNVMMGTDVALLAGKATVRERILGAEFDISPLAFLQINHAQTETLYSIVADYATESGSPAGADVSSGPRTILDLYCGTGTIGICLAKSLGDADTRIIGVDVVPEAIEDASHNAALNGLSNCEYISGTAESAGAELAARGVHADVCVIDPPRHGCGPELIEALGSIAPESIIYVSCKPETLARDVKLLEGTGYRIKEYSVADLFPRTGHVETVTLITRAGL